MAIILVLAIELALVAISIVLARDLALAYNVIPRSVLSAANLPLTDDDLRRMLLTGIAVHAPVMALFRVLFGDGVFRDSRRTAQECYCLIVAVSLFGSVVFVFTDISFSPNYFAVLLQTELTAFIAGYVAVQLSTRARDAAAGLGRLLLSGVRLLAAPVGLTAVAFASAPVALAIAYKLDDGFANSINAVRLYFNYPQESAWHLVDAFPGLTFDQPMIAKPPPGEALPYVLERQGRLVRVVHDGAGYRKETVLDIADRVGVVALENGALGFAFHPEFGRPASANRGFVFIYYTSATRETQINRLSRFDLSAGGPDDIRASEFVLIELNRQTYGFHNGGSVEFGPDGFLYVSIGDAKDRRNQQTISRTLFSGVLRIDVDRRGGSISHPPPRQPEDGRTQGYFIPSDNPFVGEADALEEFYAIGLRNPFRIGFDSETGTIWAGDVGDLRFEEVNAIVPGGNYQWPYREGNEPYNGAELPASMLGRSMPPRYVYGHTAYERVIIGGFVYRGKAYPELNGQYIFADNFSGWVSGFDIADEDPKPVRLAKANQVSQVGISSLSPGPDGGIYVTTLGVAGANDGRLLRLARGAPEPSAPVATAAAPDPAANLAAAKQIFATDCARCHGLHGRGEPVVDGVRMPDFTNPAWQASVSDQHIFEIITKGGEAVGKNAAMPPWEDVYSEAERRALVRIVRDLGKGDADDTKTH